MAQLVNPTTTVTEEMQDNIRTYEALRLLIEIAVFWQQKKILQSDSQAPLQLW